MKDTPIFFTRYGSFKVQEFFNDLDKEVINNLEKTSWKELPTPNTLNK
jgi:hypothetical protein